MKVYSSHLPTLPLALSPEQHPEGAFLFTKERESSWWLFMASEQSEESEPALSEL